MAFDWNVFMNDLLGTAKAAYDSSQGVDGQVYTTPSPTYASPVAVGSGISSTFLIGAGIALVAVLLLMRKGK